MPYEIAAADIHYDDHSGSYEPNYKAIVIVPTLMEAKKLFDTYAIDYPQVEVTHISEKGTRTTLFLD